MSYQNIFVNRHGIGENAFMITHRLIRIFKPNTLMYLKDGYLIETDYLPNEITQSSSAIPPNIVINGKLQDYVQTTENNNILGKNQIMKLENSSEIIIPIAETTDQHLAFFGCKLIKNDIPFELKNEIEMPLFQVSIGEKYVEDYLLKDTHGGGFYIERHNTPHYHQSMNENSRGYLILGKQVINGILLSKFRIPHECAIYTPSNTYHSDAYLIGDYLVIYNKTDDYNTYVLKTSDNKIIMVK
jgi:hypothetical protein